MDPQLRPRFFEADPNSADAAKRWNHWFGTFETYLKTVESFKPDRLETLIHFVDPMVSAAEYQDECVLDVTINGLASTSICEKPLAQSELTLDQAYQLARSIELAHKQSQSYVSNEPISCSTIPPISQNPEIPVDPTTAAVKSIHTCYFCGYDTRPRPNCPTREDVCKRGHFHRVCRTKNTTKFHTSCTAKPTLSSLFVAAAPTCLAHAIATIEVNGIALRALEDNMSELRAIFSTAGHPLHKSSWARRSTSGASGSLYGYAQYFPVGAEMGVGVIRKTASPQYAARHNLVPKPDSVRQRWTKFRQCPSNKQLEAVVLSHSRAATLVHSLV
ncbi:hypothetical protein CLF_108006 [Clonorchis sinensis]|uniref:Uncharacterized protein n=1 Tax=Clonorchis sinensis TaxID=79923 RepID=G7YHH5_CLOSI|nr:hypothetical protein CLF_108006 [Clonorchis sinensis]